MDGALALAVPTKKGQNLIVGELNEPKILWKSFDEKSQIWFERIFHLPITPRKSDPPVVVTLKNLLLQAQKLNPSFLSENKGYTIETHLEFPRNWGLGSSSTLIHNLASWANINPFELLQKTMGGSGYDIACAQHNTTIFFQLIDNNPIVTPVTFHPKFSDSLYFIHLNQKQKSNKEINRYQNLASFDSKKEVIRLVSDISKLLPKVEVLDDFEVLIREHEKLLSSVLQRHPIQSQFKDYFGQMKSLGAWGGDFVLATGNEDTPKYFEKKGYETILTFKEMLL